MRSAGITSAGVIAATAGAVLVVSLLLTWWDYPPVLVDPPSDLPAELDFLADGLRDQGEFNDVGYDRFSPDGFEFYDVRDIVWLITGIAGFALGLSALAGSRLTALLAPLTAALALASIVLIALALISPPDYVDITNDFSEERGVAPPYEFDYDVPFGRELGGWVALAAALGVGAGTILAMRADRR